MSTQLYPEVKDATTLGARFSQPTFLSIGVEGRSDAGSVAAVGAPVNISRPADADTQFGAASSLSALVKFLLGRAAPVVTAVASAKGTAPLLAERQTAWDLLSSDLGLRIRLTDSLAQADIEALFDNVEQAEAIQSKQVAFAGMALGTTKAGLLTASNAVASRRGVLVGPGVYNEGGTLLSGAYAAAAVAVEVAKNPDLADDMDTMVIPGLTGIERDTSGYPLFRKKMAGGVAVNDFEELLQGGVSPLEQGPNGGVQITHLRMTYKADTTMDALMTRLIVDQLFIDVRAYCLNSNFLRRGNTQANRDDLRAGVEALLNERTNWIRQKTQADGSTGFNVAVTTSGDGRQVTVHYEGIVVRGISTILVDGSLDIPV